MWTKQRSDERSRDQSYYYHLVLERTKNKHTMSHVPSSERKRKRKVVEESEVAISNGDDRKPKKKKSTEEKREGPMSSASIGPEQVASLDGIVFSAHPAYAATIFAHELPRPAFVDDLHCPLCLEIQVKSITLVPCGHSLCLSCWNAAVADANRTTCCQCNQSVSAYVVAHAMNNVIAGLVAVSPALFARDNLEVYHVSKKSVSGYHESDDSVSGEPDDFPIENESIRHNETTEVPEAVVGRHRYARKCKNTINATILEATGEGDRNAPNHPNRRNREATDHIQIHSDDIALDAALHAVHVDFLKDSTKWKDVVAIGCSAVVPIIVWRVVQVMIRWISNESV
jgi:hypothetical protein